MGEGIVTYCPDAKANNHRGNPNDYTRRYTVFEQDGEPMP